MKPDILQTQSWRCKTIVIVKRQQENHHTKNKKKLTAPRSTKLFMFSTRMESSKYCFLGHRNDPTHVDHTIQLKDHVSQ